MAFDHCGICNSDVHNVIKISNSITNSYFQKVKAISLGFLFGLGGNSELMNSKFSDLVNQKICNQCCADLHNVHHIFWQLHSLEHKLEQLQILILRKLSDNRSNEHTNFLVEEIYSNRPHWPRITHSVGWKDSLQLTKLHVTLSTEKSSSIDAYDVKPTVLIPPKEEKTSDHEFDDTEYDSFTMENEDSDSDNSSFGDDDDGDEWEPHEDQMPRKAKGKPIGSQLKTSSPFQNTISKSETAEDLENGLLCTEDPSICSKTFWTRSDLNNHIKRFHSGRNFLCDFEGCPEKFKSEVRLSQHKKRCHSGKVYHPENTVPTLLCTEDPSICSKLFRTRSDLNHHIKRFHWGRDYACDIEGCSQKFKSEQKLAQHKKLCKPGQVKEESHNPETLLLCKEDPTICNKAFRKRHDLNHHIRRFHWGRNYVCDYEGCPEKFKSEYKLNQHKNQCHTASKVFKCTEDPSSCNREYKARKNLVAHIRIYHPTDPDISCDVTGCTEIFCSKHSLQLHKRRCHGEEDPTSNSKRRKARRQEDPNDLSPASFKCTADPEYCNSDFEDWISLKRHFHERHAGRKLACDVGNCDKKFCYVESLLHHKSTDHSHRRIDFCKTSDQDSSFTFKCMEDPSWCEKEFQAWKNLREHIRNCHEGRDIPCDSCNMKFSTDVTLEYHKKRAHSGKPRPKYNAKTRTPKSEGTHTPKPPRDDSRKRDVCELCGESVSYKKLARHMELRHHSDHKFTCDFCFMEFLSNGDLKEHEFLHGNFSETYPFTCVIPECLQIYGNTTELQNHVRSNHSDWLKCDQCGMMKPTEFLLRRHKLFHKIPRPQKIKDVGTFQCRFCGKTFQRRKTCAYHEKNRHNDGSDFPHKCHICSKGFMIKGKLRRHEEIHAGTKCYRCDLCGKRFKTAMNLRQHLHTQQHKGQDHRHFSEMKIPEEGLVKLQPS